MSRDAVPGFAGLHVSPEDEYVVSLKEGSNPDVIPALTDLGFFSRRPDRQIKIRWTRYSFEELGTIKDKVVEAVLPVLDRFWIDVSETDNRIYVGVADAADVAAASTALTDLVPQDAFLVEATGVPQPLGGEASAAAQTVRSRIRPPLGGIRIQTLTLGGETLLPVASVFMPNIAAEVWAS